MTTQDLTLEALHDRIDRLRMSLRDTIGSLHESEYQRDWWRWYRQIMEIRDESVKTPEVAISLVGGTGAGKSTLLNALLGARVLPVSNMRACTAAISEVSFAQDGRYHAEIEFVTRVSWEREIQVLLEDLWDAQDTSDPDDAQDGGTASRMALSGAAMDRLWAVYRPSADADRKGWDPRYRVEPPEIRAALDSGTVEFTCDTLLDFRKRVAEYLDSKHRFWPIVKTVRMRGPFEPLRSGVKLIDLPGINDPNEAREEVTRMHLKSCRFVWIVFNIKRALTKDITALMQSDDFLRQVVMDGRADALTFVGTASDDVDRETGIDEFDLDEDATKAEVVAARNKAARREVARQVDDLAARVVAMAHERSSRTESLVQAFQQAQIFTVSAREYLRLAGLSKSDPAGIETLDQTELPALRQHMQTTCAAYGMEAHVQTMHRKIDLVLEEFSRELHSHRMRLQRQTQEQGVRQQEVDAAVSTAARFLGQRLDNARDGFRQALEGRETLLRERLKQAVEVARREMDATLMHWSRMHWCTVRAVVRRDGVFTGSTGRHDFPADLSRPILERITLAWADFFGEHIGQALDRWSFELNKISSEHSQELLRIVEQFEAGDEALNESFGHILQSTAKVLDLQVSQSKTDLQKRIEHDRRTLYEQIGEQVRANMKPAFEQAAAEYGRGVKMRMVGILSTHAHQVAAVMFDDAERHILDGVRALIDTLVRTYGDMADTVNRNAGLMHDNLRSDATALPAETLERELNALKTMSTALETMLRPASVDNVSSFVGRAAG